MSDETDPSAGMLKPAHKVGIWVICLAALVGIGFLFNGHIGGKKKAVHAEPVRVAMNGFGSQLNMPPLDDPPAPRPAYAQRQARGTAGPGPTNNTADEERRKAFESPIGVLTHTSQGARAGSDREIDGDQAKGAAWHTGRAGSLAEAQPDGWHAGLRTPRPTLADRGRPHPAMQADDAHQLDPAGCGVRRHRR
jgi:hypothetical protein